MYDNSHTDIHIHTTYLHTTYSPCLALLVLSGLIHLMSETRREGIRRGVRRRGVQQASKQASKHPIHDTDSILHNMMSLVRDYLAFPAFLGCVAWLCVWDVGFWGKWLLRWVKQSRKQTGI